MADQDGVGLPIKKAPVPLLAPTYSFTGKDWWTPLMQSWDKMRDLEKFQGIDYMIPHPE